MKGLEAGNTGKAEYSKRGCHGMSMAVRMTNVISSGEIIRLARRLQGISGTNPTSPVSGRRRRVLGFARGGLRIRRVAGHGAGAVRASR
ncbi:hypothetical protein RJZ90_004314 [Blastomyces dermatitidis]